MKQKIILGLVLISTITCFGNEWTKQEMLESCSNSNIEECVNRGIKFEKEKSFQKAYVYYFTACISRDSSSCYNLGRLYKYGLGVKKSMKDALRLYKKACDNNSPKACYALGRHYATDEIDQNIYTAFSYFEQSCKVGSASACGQVAWSYKKGVGVNQNWNSAAIYYEKSCDANDAISCAGFAGLYLQGAGVRYDKKEALKLFDKSCKLGFKKACSNSKYIKKNYDKF